MSYPGLGLRSVYVVLQIHIGINVISINIWFGAQCKNCAEYINFDVSVSISVGPCDADPCQNEGTCDVENGNYSCTCVNHYSGKNCEGTVLIEVFASLSSVLRHYCVYTWTIEF